MSEYTAAVMGLEKMHAFAQSALPNAPVQPEGPSSSIFASLRLRVAGMRRRLASSPAPTLSGGSARAQGQGT